MTPLFKKLNYRPATTIHLLGAPESFEPELAALEGARVVRKGAGVIDFALAFAQTRAGLDAVSAVMVRHASDDAILWVAYPKGSSKRFSCEFNRDSGWSVLESAGYETVRQVAIDADWTALRFRRSEFVSTRPRPRNSRRQDAE